MTSALEVGQAGSGTLEIAAGGLVRNTSAILGKQAASIAEVVVDGPGSAWNSSGAVQIGLGADAEALMYVQNGATATAASATIGAGGATGGLGAVFVTGPNARWAVTNDIVVGDGVAGVLDITQGGVASGRDGIIASSAGGSGLATISGPGSQWNLSRNLYVGGGIGAASGMGTLEISEGGAVNVTGGVRVWSTGTILFNEGQLTAFNVEILGGQLSGTGTFTSRLLTKPATIEVPDGGLLTLTGQLTTDGGTITKTGLGTLAISGAQVHNMPATLRVSQGAVALNSDALNGTFSRLSVDIDGGGSATFNTTQHLKVLEIDNGRALMPGSGKVLVTDTPSIAAEGQLDIDANAMVVRSGNVAQVRAQLIAGRGSAGGVVSGKWDGTSGITSTAARLADATSETRVVGYALNGELLVSYQTFAGEPVGLNDVLVRYTKNGDANLDGVVNNNDITILAGFYRPGETGKHWYQADFNYDGEVNNNDITTLAGFYRPDEPPVAAAVAGLVAVPEPGMMLMALPAALLGRRRRVSCAR
jgi:T5SS/PEP-CTERM-associated repeat protein